MIKLCLLGSVWLSGLCRVSIIRRLLVQISWLAESFGPLRQALHPHRLTELSDPVSCVILASAKRLISPSDHPSVCKAMLCCSRFPYLCVSHRLLALRAAARAAPQGAQDTSPSLSPSLIAKGRPALWALACPALFRTRYFTLRQIILLVFNF